MLPRRPTITLTHDCGGLRERPSKHHRAVVGDRDRVLGVGGARTVGCTDGPAVRVEGDLIGRTSEPRLECDGQARHELEATARATVVGDMGVFVHGPSYPVAAELGVDRVAVVVGNCPDRRGDVAQAVAWLRRGDPGIESGLGGADEAQVLVCWCAHDHAAGCVGDPTVDADRKVHAQEVSVAQCVVTGEPVENRIVDRQADDVAERAVAKGRGVVPVAGLCATLVDPAAGMVLQLEQVDADVSDLAELGEDLGDELSGDLHPLELCGRLQLDHGGSLAARLRYNNTDSTLAGIDIPAVPSRHGSPSPHARADPGWQATGGAPAPCESSS
jgi:hypothetical protein